MKARRNFPDICAIVGPVVLQRRRRGEERGAVVWRGGTARSPRSAVRYGSSAVADRNNDDGSVSAFGSLPVIAEVVGIIA